MLCFPLLRLEFGRLGFTSSGPRCSISLVLRSEREVLPPRVVVFSFLHSLVIYLCVRIFILYYEILGASTFVAVLRELTLSM